MRYNPCNVHLRLSETPVFIGQIKYSPMTNEDYENTILQSSFSICPYWKAFAVYINSKEVSDEYTGLLIQNVAEKLKK